MSAEPEKGQILVLVDGSAGSRAAASAAVEIARALGRPLAILGVTGAGAADARIAEAVAQARALATERVGAVDAIQSTGDVLEVARKRVSETPTTLVILGADPKPGHFLRLAGGHIWRVVRALAPPVLIVPAGSAPPSKILFCSGGERFTDEGARMVGRLAAGLGAPVVLLHVSPQIPEIYSGPLGRDASPEKFLESNSRLARNLRRQLEIFRAAGAQVSFRLAWGDVADRVVEELRASASDLLVVGSSPARGGISAYVLGDVAREIAGRAGRAVLIVRPRQPGFWAELWRSLREGPAEEGPPATERPARG
ncbi:MAG TPA: universal stress protein [Thermoanaerobaculia bacterium]|nr:universal stress protein [Thermoanaerobaculia bacterium]